MENKICMNDLQTEILNDIKEIEIDCPECQCVADDQYTCTTCGCQGGNGKINVFQWLKSYLKTH